MRGERFEKWPDEEETEGFSSDIASILTCAMQFINQAGVAIPISDLMGPAATIINQSVVNAWTNKILPDYKGNLNDPDDKPGKYEWQTFIERIGYCTTLIQKAIDLCEDDDEEDITRYENLIHFHKQAIDSCSWDYNYTDWGKSWHKEWQLSDSAKEVRRALIKTYEAQIEIIKFNKGVKEGFEKAERDRIEREEAQKRFDAYWTEHAKEKEQLELERKGLQEQIANLNASQNEQVAALNKEIETIPGQAEIDNIEVRIKKLSAEKASLGFFKGKEKKALQEQIDQTASEKSIIRERMEFAKKAIESKISAIKNDIQKELNTLQGRISDIDAELTKPR